MENSNINVGLIGFGIAGQVFHAPFIALVPGMHLAKISTTNEASIAYAREHYPTAQIVSDAHAIIDDPSIHLVVIGTPNTAHFPLAKEAMLAGKHVIVEKPFTINSEEAEALIDISRKQQRLLTVHHNRRYDSDFRTVKKIIAGGLLGNLVEYEAHYDRYRPQLKANAWREESLPGAGILYDLGSHLIDQAVQLFGMPDEVRADIRIQRPGARATDQFELVFGYPSLKVTLKGGMLVREPGPHFVLHGIKGSFIKFGMDVQENALKAGLTPANRPDWGVEPKELWGTLHTELEGLTVKGTVESEKGNYLDYFINVRDAIRGTASLDVKPEHARDTIRLIELATRSSQEKRAVLI